MPQLNDWCYSVASPYAGGNIYSTRCTVHTCSLSWARVSRGCKAGLRSTAFCPPSTASSNALTASRLYTDPCRIAQRQCARHVCFIVSHYITLHYITFYTTKTFHYITPALWFFDFFLSFDCCSGPTPFPPDSPATCPVPLPCGVHQRYPMNSSIRAETVLRETLPGQFGLPLYCGQRNSTKFASAPMSLPQGLCAE